MERRLLLLAIVFVYTFSNSLGQQPRGNMGQGGMPKESRITGKIIDKTTFAPVEYATIGIFSMRDSALVSGGITDATGAFSIGELPYGRFYADISFIGYKKSRINNIGLNPNQKMANLGEVKLELSSTTLSAVEIVGNRNQLEYKIDKKVITVGQDVLASGGTAVDALENTPSVQVDIEGNVSLRGSGNFTVLIDGKPSVLKGSEALQQIPASIIQNIEIITNPSAKYDPEGSSGIINIIMKKSKQAGMNGVVNSSVSTNGGFAGDFLFNVRASKFNYYLGANYNKWRFENKMKSNKETYINTERNPVYYEETSGEGVFEREGYGVKGGIDFYMDTKNTFSISGNYRENEFERNSNSRNHNYRVPLDSAKNNQYYLRNNSFDRDRNFVEGNIDYTHKFNENGHQLIASVNYSQGPSNETSILEQFATDSTWNWRSDIDIPFYQRTPETGEETELTTKIDYTFPISEKSKLEAGYQGDYELSKENYRLFSGYGNIDKLSENINQYRDVELDDIVHAFYSTYAGSFKPFDYQVGMRLEYTDRLFKQNVTSQDFNLKKWDFFPTLHLSKKLPKDFQVQASYSKRIRRPGGREMDPGEVIIDSRNIRVGNPEILPEYTDSYELNVQKTFGGAGFISGEFFHRHSSNLISEYEFKRNDTISIQTFRNFNDNYSTGFEGMINMPLAKWWILNGSINLFDYRLKGDIGESESIDKKSFSWSTRFNSMFRLKWGMQIQIMGFYNAPNITAQGRREGFFFTNAGVRQDFFKKKLTASVQIRDIFGNNKFQRESSGPMFKSFYTMQRQSQVITFSLSFKINNYKPERKGDRENMNESEFDNGGGMM